MEHAHGNTASGNHVGNTLTERAASRLAPVDGLDSSAQERIDSTVARIGQAFTPPVNLEVRLDRLDRLESALRRAEGRLLDALAQDLGKCATEAWTTELGTVFGEIAHLRKLLPTWVTPDKVPGSPALAPSRAWVDHQPLGTVLVIAPWNYPVQLVLSPLAGALAAGNTVVVKPSEVTPNVAQVLATVLDETMSDCVGVVCGGVAETTRLLQHRFDHIFYTGNSTVARVVMRAAAEHLTPVTLELGGKSPVWVDDTVNLEVAARRIAWSKFINAGQTCVAPDYVMGTAETLQGLEPLLRDAVRQLYGSDPAASDPYGRIVTRRHLEKLLDTLGTVAGEDIVFGADHNLSRCYLGPTVLRQKPDGPFMKEEIFGPVLPLVAVADHHAAMKHIAAGEKPLALYVFSQTDQVLTDFRERTSSGGMAIGAPLIHLAHPHLPFGGVGESGTGNYHGQYSLKTFSHERAVLDKPLVPDTLKVVYPPYTALKSKGAKLAMWLPSPVRALRKILGKVPTRRP